MLILLTGRGHLRRQDQQAGRFRRVAADAVRLALADAPVTPRETVR